LNTIRNAWKGERQVRGCDLFLDPAVWLVIAHIPHECPIAVREIARGDHSALTDLIVSCVYLRIACDLRNHFDTTYVVRDFEELKILNIHLYTKNTVRGSELTLEGRKEILVKFGVCSASQTFGSSLLRIDGPEDSDVVTEWSLECFRW